MATAVTGTRERTPRRGRYLIPKTTPRRAEVIAALSVVALAGHLVFAQLTIVLGVIFFAIAKVTRWRPQWLAVPAVVGVIWALAIGPASAVRGFVAGPRQIVAYLAGVGGDPSRVLHLGAAFGGAQTWLPRQLPLALVAGAAEAALAVWLTWLHTDEWQLPEARPGAVIAARRWYVARSVRAGGVVTRDGACLGIDQAAGERAALSWREAAAGVLCTGAAGSGTTTTSLQLVHAAIRRRKPVIAVDLSGDRQLAEWFAIVCGATSTPLQAFSAIGPGYYEPLRVGDSGRRTALAMGMIDWAGTADQYRRSCGAYLNDLFAVTAAAPGDPRTPILDEMAHLLNPAALRARAERVPPFHPHRKALIERVKVSASLFESDPQTAATLSAQLAELRSSAMGRWMAPAPGERPGDEPIDLGQILRRRGVALFALGEPAHGRAAVTVASLVAQDVMALSAQLGKMDVTGDGMVWFDECGSVPPGVLADLITRTAGVGMPTVLTTTSGPAAERLTGHANTVVIHRMADPVMAERFAQITGEKLVPGEIVPAQEASVHAGALAASRMGGRLPAAPRGGTTGTASFGQAGDLTFVRRPLVSPESLCALENGEFAMVVKGPSRRLVAPGRTITARLPSLPRGHGATTPQAQPAADATFRGVSAAWQPLRTYGQQPGVAGSASPTGPVAAPGPAAVLGQQPYTAGRPVVPGHGTGAGDPAVSIPPELTGSMPGEFPENRPWPT